VSPYWAKMHDSACLANCPVSNDKTESPIFFSTRIFTIQNPHYKSTTKMVHSQNRPQRFPTRAGLSRTTTIQWTSINDNNEFGKRPPNTPLGIQAGNTTNNTPRCFETAQKTSTHLDPLETDRGGLLRTMQRSRTTYKFPW